MSTWPRVVDPIPVSSRGPFFTPPENPQPQGIVTCEQQEQVLSSAGWRWRGMGCGVGDPGPDTTSLRGSVAVGHLTGNGSGAFTLRLARALDPSPVGASPRSPSLPLTPR